MQKSISTLQRQAKAAPQYMLKLEGLNLYLADKQGLSGANLTSTPKKAMKYAVGFDSTDIKLKAWNIAACVQFNNKDVKFEVVYL